MKRTASILLVLVMMLSLMVPTAFAADDYKGSTVILYTGNLRGDVDTYAQIAAVLHCTAGGVQGFRLVMKKRYIKVMRNHAHELFDMT